MTVLNSERFSAPVAFSGSAINGQSPVIVPVPLPFPSFDGEGRGNGKTVGTPLPVEVEKDSMSGKNTVIMVIGAFLALKFLGVI